MIINDRYEYNPQKDLLGQGGFGKVYKAKDTHTNQIVALKFVEKDKFSDKYNLEGEFQKASSFDHPNLIRYFDGFDYELSNSIGQKSVLHVAAMEYANAGNLKEYDKRNLTYQQKEKIIREILSGLEYLHAKNIVHRDIKPANILLNKDANGNLTIKVSDFGISKQLKNEYSTISNVLGTTEYMSPEQLGLTTDGKIGKSADLWSLGILIYELFLGETPFGKSSDGVSQSKILNGILNFKKAPRMSEIPEPYQKMVSRCLVLDPKKRAQGTKELTRLIQQKEPVKKVAEAGNWKKMAIGAFVLSGILGLLLIGNLMSGNNTGSSISIPEGPSPNPNGLGEGNDLTPDNDLINSLKNKNQEINTKYTQLLADHEELKKDYIKLEKRKPTAGTDAKYAYQNADKMNVLYIGVDNPISLNVEGVSASNLRVSITGSGGEINKGSSNLYNVKVTSPGECKITISGDGINSSKTYRVKRIPDPVAKLSKYSGGSIGFGEFKAQDGVSAFLDNFDFDAKCNVQGYNLVYQAKRQDPVESVNSGARFSNKSQQLLQSAKPGDLYYFDNVKAICPGDKADRSINSMVFKIK